MLPVSKTMNSPDRLSRNVNRQFAKFLLILALLCGILQYFGRPISCWTPSHFTGSMANYAYSWCYFADSYYLPEPDVIPGPPEPSDLHLNRYKWTPVLILLVAAIYLIPDIAAHFWRNSLQTDIDCIINLCHETTSGSDERRKTAADELVFELQCRLESKAKGFKETGFRGLISKLTPSVGLLLYFRNLLKNVLFLAGTILPLIALAEYSGFSFDTHSQTLNSKGPSKNVTLFPKTILCNCDIRQLQTIQRYTFQCNVSSNEIFEKLAIFICFMVVVISACRVGEVVVFSVTSLSKTVGCMSYGSLYPICSSLTKEFDSSVLNEFVTMLIKADGVYLMNLIGQNSSRHVTSQIFRRLLKNYSLRLDEATFSKPSKADNERR